MWRQATKENILVTWGNLSSIYEKFGQSSESANRGQRWTPESHQAASGWAMAVLFWFVTFCPKLSLVSLALYQTMESRP